MTFGVQMIPWCQYYAVKKEIWQGVIRCLFDDKNKGCLGKPLLGIASFYDTSLKLLGNSLGPIPKTLCFGADGW